MIEDEEKEEEAEQNVDNHKLKYFVSMGKVEEKKETPFKIKKNNEDTFN
ncbi:hypothetical protein [Enterococcus sp. S22(2020)]|nr:hypothetical protein [Enterococcus sp. S22(2020)]